MPTSGTGIRTGWQLCRARPVQVKIDKTDPTIVASVMVTGGGSYTSGDWTKQTVTVHFTCSDALSGIASGDCPADVVVSADTLAAGQNVSGNVSDRAGNSASSNTINVKVDKTDPSITFVSQTPAANANGWNNSDVTVKWAVPTRFRARSVASSPMSARLKGLPTRAVLARITPGNSASATREVKIDKTDPTIVASATVTGGGSYTSGDWTKQTVTVHFTCSDALSGIALGDCPADVVVSADTLRRVRTFRECQ